MSDLFTNGSFILTDIQKHYNHIANQNKAANVTVYRQWIESHTPAVIYEANLARQHLRRLGGKLNLLRDDRQVKGPRGAYNWFYKQRMLSGDFKGLKVSEASKLVGREWKGLSADEKKVCCCNIPNKSGADVS